MPSMNMVRCVPSSTRDGRLGALVPPDLRLSFAMPAANRCGERIGKKDDGNDEHDRQR